MPKDALPASLSRGRQRMRELAAEAEAERVILEAELLDSLGRHPTALDKLAAESISAAVVRARKLRARGRDDSEQRRSIAQLMRASGFRPDKPTPAAPKTLQEQLRQRGYETPEVSR